MPAHPTRIVLTSVASIVCVTTGFAKRARLRIALPLAVGNKNAAMVYGSLADNQRLSGVEITSTMIVMERPTKVVRAPMMMNDPVRTNVGVEARSAQTVCLRDAPHHHRERKVAAMASMKIVMAG